jgi:hypothetical protein
MKISVYCGLTREYKNTTNGLIDNECGYDGVIELTEEQEEDFKDGALSMDCPCCHGELFQSMDHFEEIKED